MDIEFDFKGDPLGGVISNCEVKALLTHTYINASTRLPDTPLL